MTKRNLGTYIHYGCGLIAPDGWRNFDASPTLRLQRIPLIASIVTTRISLRFPPNVQYGDITKNLPLQNSSAKMVYCSHVLEHLALEDLRHALRETSRILMPGGTFRMVLPDLEIMIDRYHERRGHEHAAVEFMRETILGSETRPRRIGQILRDYFGNSQHRWMWDYASLARELEDAGFQRVRRAQFGDNLDPMLALVESADRWQDCLGIECSKATETR